MPATISVFDLPDRLSAKADPDLIADDERHFAVIAETLQHTIAGLAERLDEERRSPGGSGQAALERDLEIHRLTARLRALHRFGLDLTLGRIVHDATGETTYIGRLGLTDDDGRRLLVDWRSPAAEPFFGATHANPMGLRSRRRYRWTNGRITDYWDEVFTADGLEQAAALDDQSAFIASLGGSRSVRMRDVLGTIQSDQDAIIRAGSRGALVVDGGPGTGKTVVALHRTAYLLYADPRLKSSRSGVLFVGPSDGYLAYISDVLPSLGEEGAQIATLRDLVPEGASVVPEADPEVARLKSSKEMVGVIGTIIRFYEEPPTTGLTVETPWADLSLSAEDWAEAFAAPERGTPHNEAREHVLERLLEILGDQVGEEVPPSQLRRAVLQHEPLMHALHRAWPLLDARALVRDLWMRPGFLRNFAPWLSADDVRRLQRTDGEAWTVEDLPLLDAARRGIGDAEVAVRRRRQEAAIATERERYDTVIEDLIQAESLDDGEGVMKMLRGTDLQNTLVQGALLPPPDPDALAGPFAHIVVDEAQELSDAQWQMLLQRNPSGSFTIVGDRAQARHGFPESWQERLARVGLTDARIASLTINYRTPEEVMAVAEPVIRAALPDANVPTSIRSAGVPVVHGTVVELDRILGAWLAEHPEGIAAVIASGAQPSAEASVRVRWLTPELAKGLEFDLVILIDPDSFGAGTEGAVDRYVAMTRATQQLVILSR